MTRAYHSSRRKKRRQSGGWIFSRKKNPWSDGRWAVAISVAETVPSKAIHSAFDILAGSLGGLQLKTAAMRQQEGPANAVTIQYSFPDAFKAAQFKKTLQAMSNMWYSTEKFLITNSEIVKVK